MHLHNILSAYALHSTRHYLPRSFASGRGRRISSSILFCNERPLPTFPFSPPTRIDETIATGRPRERGCPPIAPSLLYFRHPFTLLLRSRRGAGADAMMKGEMDYSRESAGNDITLLRDGFHFFLYPMALSHSRICFDKLETPIRAPAGSELHRSAVASS